MLKVLKEAGKYNWRTEEKENLSIKSRIKYIMKYGTIKEINKIVKEKEYKNIMIELYQEEIKNDISLKKEHKYFLYYILFLI